MPEDETNTLDETAILSREERDALLADLPDAEEELYLDEE